MQDQLIRDIEGGHDAQDAFIAWDLAGKTSANPRPREHAFMNTARFLLFPALMALLLSPSAGRAVAATNSSPGEVAPALLWLQDQLDLQTKRLDRLYRALGPQLEEMEQQAAAFEKQQQEDKGLAMGRVWETRDDEFTDRAECSPTEQSFAAVAKDGSIRICDLNGRILRTLRHAEEAIRAVAYCPDGSRLLAGTQSGKVLLWELKSATGHEVTQRPYKIERVAWLGKTGRALVCGARGEAIKGPEPEELRNVQGDLFEIENGKPIWEFTGWQHLDYQNLMIAPNGEWVAVLKILKGRGAYLLDARTGSITANLLTDASQGLSVAVSPDSQQVAIGNPGIYVWNVNQRAILRHLEGHQNWVVALAFSPDGKRLVSGSGDSTARVWDVKNGTEVGRLRFPGSSTYVHSVGFSCDGKRVLAAAEGGQLIIARVPPMAGAP